MLTEDHYGTRPASLDDRHPASDHPADLDVRRPALTGIPRNVMDGSPARAGLFLCSGRLAAQAS
jgi:hypothetical protein